MNAGKSHPGRAGSLVDRPRLKPRLRKRIPRKAPKIKPTRAVIPLRSPPANRSKALTGQPRNTRAPIIIRAPSKKRTRGAEPPLVRNSLKAKAAMKLPSTSPSISGRMYCTTSARCKPSAPVISLRKQAAQKPMLAGLPHLTSNEARTPKTSPEKINNIRGLSD